MLEAGYRALPPLIPFRASKPRHRPVALLACLCLRVHLSCCAALSDFNGQIAWIPEAHHCLFFFAACLWCVRSSQCAHSAAFNDRNICTRWGGRRSPLQGARHTCSQFATTCGNLCPIMRMDIGTYNTCMYHDVCVHASFMRGHLLSHSLTHVFAPYMRPSFHKIVSGSAAIGADNNINAPGFLHPHFCILAPLIWQLL